jgi:hypothetical protein
MHPKICYINPQAAPVQGVSYFNRGKEIIQLEYP